ncbi:hypothetical protein [uncultured Flavobacterium sp.]|uniref:hypothetical protein n=1 Tax=uncultured Flavobacterium sp. TaxID=165435 RepID=UPI00292D11EF|nr:hypothetical protein [uncultured Flavobacterium sp.]
MIKKLLIFLITTAFLSCDSSNESRCSSYYYGIGIDFYVRNTQGEDILDPQNSNSLDVSKIKLFYVVNGVAQEYYNSNLDSPRGFRIFNSKNGYKIRIEMNNLDKSKKRITYVQWNETSRDTLESTFEIDECYTVVKQVWLNGKFVWDRDIDESICPIIER